MLNIGKLAPGGEGYYLHTVASGVEDYYTGAGEAPGYWLGAAAGDLDLAGRVEPETLRAVLGGLDPASGQPLTGRASRRSVPGFDLTFRAPKSVSLLYALADSATSRAVRDAHDVAVAAAVGYLERHAACSRRGHGGAERVPVGGVAAAAFRHRTSRAGDPLLHTHVLVANLARAIDDGCWRTLDGRQLYLHAKTAGYLYQTHLRAELTRRLGVEWREVRNGCADLEGVPDDVLRAFSRRRADIEAHMAARGETSARAAQVATLATRRGKSRDIDGGALGIEWQTRAVALGFGPEQVAALTGRTAPRKAHPDMLAAAAEELAGPEGLTARASTFSRRDAIRAWCEKLPVGADVDEVLALADRLLADGTVVPLDHAQVTATRIAGDQVTRRDDGRVVSADLDERRYSTPELLTLEQRVVAGAAARRHGAAAVADAAVVERALARRPSIAGEQAAMVRRLTTSGAGVEVVVGKAGTGKTFALDAAREAWQASGIRVVGCALAARAAAELHAGAGIPSFTIDGLLADVDRAGPHSGLASGSVLVVDEAGMVGTRKLARLLDLAKAADAKVVLVGDHRQLPEIDAGGVFRGLVHRLPVVELVDNRRQHARWERAALAELRDGDPAAALDAYDASGRVHVGDSADAVREQLVSDWWRARAAADDARTAPGVMIALRTADVENLNQRARTRLAAAGQLTGPALAAACGREFQVGDRVVCLRNDRRLGVVNGTRATVTGVDLANRRLGTRVEREDRAVQLPAAYLDEGHLVHAYAVTAHKAQGLTTERTWVLGSDAMYREWGYVALSRGRRANHLYLVADDDGSEGLDDLHHHSAPPRDDPLRHAAARLTRSRAQGLALDGVAFDSDVAGARTPAALERIDRQLDRLRHARDRAARAREQLRRELAAAQGEGCAAPRRLSLVRGRRTPRAETARMAADLDAWQQRIAELDAAIDEASHRRAATAKEEEVTSRRAPRPVDKSKVRVRPGQHREDDLGIAIG